MAKKSSAQQMSFKEYLSKSFDLIQYALLIKKNMGHRALMLMLQDENTPKWNAELIELWLSREPHNFAKFKNDLQESKIRKRKIKRL